MSEFTPEQSTCPVTGAAIFRTPEHVKRQLEHGEQLKAVEQQNQQLHAALKALLAAQPASIKSKLPESVLELADES